MSGISQEVQDFLWKFRKFEEYFRKNNRSLKFSNIRVLLKNSGVSGKFRNFRISGV
jgi:hypothetical protein